MQRTLLLAFFLHSLNVMAQRDVLTFGLQFKPIVPSNLLNAGEESLISSDIEYTLSQRLGYSFGGVIRAGFTDWLSLESGISYVRRNFYAGVSHPELSFSDTTAFRLIGYEIPLLGMVYVRLSDRIYMDVAFGLSFDMYPTNVTSSNHPDFAQISVRRRWLQTSLLANVGWEYRTKNSGYFYIGASYHRPFQDIYLSRMYYEESPSADPVQMGISGNYLTIDLRYFFHEEPREKKKKEKRDPDTMPQWMKR